MLLKTLLKGKLGSNYESNPVVDDGLPDGYLCDYCMKKFRADVLPVQCILNGLLFEDVPEEIAQLNQYEKVLIQRAKGLPSCYQDENSSWQAITS